MIIYSINGGALTYLEAHEFTLEKHMQQLIERNLGAISELELVKSEFIIKNKRIDTLCYNRRLKAFVIIEYKRGSSYSVIDQGIAYLKLLLDSKAEVILEYNEKHGSELKRKDVRWKNCYVIFAAPSFNDHQINAASFKELKIILWLVTLYGDSILAINEISDRTCNDVKEPVKAEEPPVQSWMSEPLWININKIAKGTPTSCPSPQLVRRLTDGKGKIIS